MVKRCSKAYLAGFIGLVVLLGWSGERLAVFAQRQQWRSPQYEPPPPGMVFVPAGEFWMGSNDATADPDERPFRRLFVRAFYIDRFEVTNRRYQQFKPDHRFPPGEEELPVTFVLKRDAEAFCRWAGRRLPTTTEWEKAARGTDGRLYPWGNQFDPELANVDRHAGSRAGPVVCQRPAASAPSTGKLAVGSFPGGASPYGCEDMAGNVWEWVSDTWKDEGFLRSGTAEERGILRGGASSYSERQARSSYQAFEDLDATCHDVGFRCAVDAVPKKR